jgi:cardiolipin synthase
MAVEYWFCNPNEAQGAAGVFSRGWTNVVTDRMIEMVDSARQSLVITSFYFKPTESLMAAVVAAARRGVRVEVFHSHVDALPATDLAWIAAAANIPRLLDAGVVIRERPQGEHSKIVLVDDAWVACGSYNFEDAAHDRLAEAMVATRDAATVEAFRTVVRGLREDPTTVEVTRESWAALPARLRRRITWFGWLKRFT